MLSVCLITKDEELFIAGCLRSVHDIADEIIIVDTGSNDATLGIAKQFSKVKVFRHEWSDDFAAARNVTLKHASGDWILVLDADERVHPFALNNIATITAERPERCEVYALKVTNLTCDNDSSKNVTHFANRLFSNYFGLRYSGAIHEQLLLNGEQPDVITLYDVSILHHGYLPSVMSAKDKNVRNLKLLQASIAAEPDNPFHRFNLGVTYRSAGNADGALQAFRDVLRLADAKHESKTYYHATWVYIAGILLDTGMLTDALDLCRIAPDDVLLIPDFWCVFGGVLLGLGEHEQARTLFQQCLSMRGDVVLGISDRTCFAKAEYGILQINKLLADKALDDYV